MLSAKLKSRLRLSSLLGEATFALLLLVLIDIMPLGIKAVLTSFTLLFLLCLWFRPLEKTIVVSMLLLSLFLANAILPPFMKATYFRPHEILAKKEYGSFKTYEPKANITVESAHGDLYGMAQKDPRATKLKKYRKEQFSTDEYGYRNPTGHAELNPPFVLVGDSFVVGTGNTQEESLSYQLRALGVENYNLGHPGDLAEYLASVKQHPSEKIHNAKKVFFLFEGNDFFGRNYCNPIANASPKILGLHRGLKELHISRFLFALFSNLSQSQIAGTNSNPVIFGKSNTPIAFLKEYFEASTTEQFDASCMEKLLRENKEIIDFLVFIPEKSRVHANALPTELFSIMKESPSAQALQQIARKLKIPLLDLTPVFQAHAKKELLYWEDDTHWNPRGIAVAARALKKFLAH